MKSFGPHHYVPVLTAKPAELKALRLIPSERTIYLTPLFVLPSDSDAGSVGKFTGTLVENWADRDAFIDGEFVPSLNVGATHSLEWLVAEAQKVGVRLVPAMSLTASSTYRDAVKNILEIQSSPKELAIRLTRPYWNQISKAGGDMDRTMRRLKLGRANVHLILAVIALLALSVLGFWAMPFTIGGAVWHTTLYLREKRKLRLQGKIDYLMSELKSDDP